MSKQLNKIFKYGVVLLTLYTYYKYFWEGGSEMVVVNIIMLVGMITFCTKAMMWLVPMVIKELKEMED